jgi:hypothetical protein
MMFSGGKFKGRQVSSVLFGEPQYAKWLMAAPVRGELHAVQLEVKRLVGTFDRMPRVRHACANCCSGSSSRRPCPICDCVGVHTYEQALEFAKWQCGGSPRASRRVVRCLAISKGLDAAAPGADLEAIAAPQVKAAA